MRCKMIKVRTASIPSRTAANQFHEKHGYDIEWMQDECLFYVHDTQKDQLHVIHMDEVTNFALEHAEPAEFIKRLRAGPLELAGSIAFLDPEPKKRGPGRPPKQAETEQP